MSALPSSTLTNEVQSLLGSAQKEFTADQRVQHVEEMIERLIDLVGPVISLHETNRIVMFSEALSQQIPRSYAANAFRDFRRALLDSEMTKLVRLWDKPQWSRNCLQTAYWLTVDPAFRAVCDARVKDRFEPYVGYNSWNVERQTRRWNRLDALAPSAFDSPVFRRLENYRHKYLAHSHIQTARERTGPIPLPTYKDQRRLLMRTIVILRLLNHVVRQSSFDWSGIFEIAQKNSEALWHRCTFSVLE